MVIDFPIHKMISNSERIKQMFGNYGIDILQNDKLYRVSNLYSMHDMQKVCRTIAITKYPKFVDPRFSKEHLLITEGQSIGDVFTGNGWTIEKRYRFFGELESSQNFSKVLSLMGNISPSHLAIHIYQLIIKKAGSKFVYANISEIYHPEYMGLDDLKRIYVKGINSLLKPDKHVQQIIEVVLQKIISF